jgi:NADH dehydrogenase
VGQPLGRLLVTGANGHLGRELIERVLRERHWPGVTAVVRSERAAAALDPLLGAGGLEVVLANPGDADALTDAGRGCSHAVHLVGILKQSAGNRYADAHERTASALARAAAKNGLVRIVYPSILGASLDSRNACLASRARAERLLLEGEVAAVVLRMPLVLGPGQPGTRALCAAATARLVPLVRGGASLEQPLDAADAVEAIRLALTVPGVEGEILDLAGPQSLPRRALVARAAELLGTRSRVLPVPGLLARLLALGSELMLNDPPLTRAMLGVLEHDDRVDVAPACERLGLTLTPLDETLRRCLTERPAR